MTEEATIEDKTAAAVAERRKRGPNKMKPAAKPVEAIEAQPVSEAVFEVITAPEPYVEQPKPKGKRLFPVRLMRNYHPINDFLLNGAVPSPEQRVKVFAGQEIDMDLEEARDIIGKGIAARNDPIG